MVDPDGRLEDVHHGKRWWIFDGGKAVLDQVLGFGVFPA
jgi:hypothetical protein